MGTANAMSARSLQFYVIARRWASDLEFFDIEIAFLHRLIDDYFIALSSRKYFEALRPVGKNLLKLEEDRSRLASLLAKQLKQVELMAEDVIPENSEDLAVNQVHLEQLMTNLTFDYRNVKKVLFALVEHVMRDYKVLNNIRAN